MRWGLNGQPASIKDFFMRSGEAGVNVLAKQ